MESKELASPAKLNGNRDMSHRGVSDIRNFHELSSAQARDQQQANQVRKARGNDTMPKQGKVNEMCRQWLVHEDGALAYQLQSQEINQHLTGNKSRNAQVREDFPCAKDEQLREQQLAEQAAAVYHKMLQEQEELDKQIAQQLAEKIEHEERMKRRALEMHDENMARKLLDREKVKKNQSPRRQAPAMPLPSEDYFDLYTEPYTPSEKLQANLQQLDIQDGLVGLPLDEALEKQIQEERDAELARKLQEQLSNSEESILNRDRMLAMEAQDKELAKLLQERERAKAKRAKERAKQKSLAKKQQLLQQQQQQQQIMPDDSYSSPIDLLPQRTVLHTVQPSNQIVLALDEETNYSYPVDILPNPKPQNEHARTSSRSNDTNGSRYEPAEKLSSNSNFGHNETLSDNNEMPPPPVRPTQLDLRSPLTQKINKPRYPDPVESAVDDSPSKLVNIAMAIDPTYPRRTTSAYSPPSYDTTSSTVTTSTSSSSPGLILPTPDIPEDDPSPVPPYMPIQGQRRTASLEKKSKKKAKDGCKQQ